MNGNRSPSLEPRAERPREVVARAAALAVLAGAFALLAAWSWRKWTDVHIDFGNELYIAWRLSEGDALYLDIAHRNGPLSHYANALWFSLFGVSLRTLVFCNLAILAGICALLYTLLRRACDRLTAVVGVLFFLAVFAFSQYVGIANYNYVTPYHHFQTHGIALSLVLVLALDRAARSGSAAAAAGAGACLGLLFLTKAELFAPALAAAALGAAWIAAARPRERGRALAALGLAAVAPPAIATAALAAQMPADIAWGGVLGNFRHLSGGLLGDAFYRRGAGLDDPFGNALVALGMAAALAGFAAALLAADRWLPRAAQGRAGGAVVFAALLALLIAAPELVPWRRLPRALPLVAGGAAAALLVAAARRRRDPDALARLALPALFSVLALGLLGKMLLRARVEHYGFALAMPAALVAVAALVYGLPRAARALGQRGSVARAGALAGVAAAAVFFLRESDRIYAHKTFPVGRGADAILVEDPRVSPRGRVMGLALAALEAELGPHETLLVLPEGISLNYWLRKRNPTRFDLFLPTEQEAFGADAMLADLRAHPPDVVALVHRGHREFGVGPFGTDPRNGAALLAWVRAHYRPVQRFGAEPFADRGFGIEILRRAEAPQPPLVPGPAAFR